MVSQRINNLSESQTIAMAQKSRELKAKGIDVISLSLGEPDFNTPDFIKSAAIKAINENYNSYTPVSGYLELREAISKKFKRDNNLDYSPDQIVCSTGAKQSLANVVMSLVNPGDEVIVPAPYWVSYIEMIKLAEGVPVIIDANITADFKITPEQLEESISNKTKLLIFSSPCNPTGSIYSKEELAALANVIATKKDMYVISDEIYEHINFVGKHNSIAENSIIYDQVITVNGVSKAFAMTGWRLGYIGAPEWIAKACDKMQGQVTSGTNCITQRAAITAMKEDPSCTHAMRDAFKVRRDFILSCLEKMEGVKVNQPKGAFYVFPDISAFFGKNYMSYSIKNASDLCMYLLEEAKVAMVTGEAFGNKDCIRISYATSLGQLEKAMQRISEALKKLN